MAAQSQAEPKTPHLRRAAIEVGFIIFLYYSNLLMGQFTARSGHGKTMAAAFHDIFTLTNFAIAVVSACLGYAVFERLRKML